MFIFIFFLKSKKSRDASLHEFPGLDGTLELNRCGCAGAGQSVESGEYGVQGYAWLPSKFKGYLSSISKEKEKNIKEKIRKSIINNYVLFNNNY